MSSSSNGAREIPRIERFEILDPLANADCIAWKTELLGDRNDDTAPRRPVELGDDARHGLDDRGVLDLDDGDRTPTQDLERFLERTREVVAYYNVSQGLQFSNKGHARLFRSIVDGRRQVRGEAKLDDLPATAGATIPVIEDLITDPAHSSAVVVDYFEMIAPNADVAFMVHEDKANLVSLQRWSSDPSFAATDNLVILVTEHLSDISRRITASPQLATIQIPFPEVEERVRAEFTSAGDNVEVIGMCVQLEAEAAAIEDPVERAEMLEGFGLGEGALFRMVRSAYHLLGLRTFFTTGEKESRAWTFYAGSSAPECAGRIHTDFQRGFIKAEVIHWDELLEIGSWTKGKELGKIRIEGKDYHPIDGDVMEFRFNV